MDELGTKSKLLDDETYIICKKKSINQKQLNESKMVKKLENEKDVKIVLENKNECPEVWEELDEPLSKEMLWLDRQHSRLITAIKNYTRCIKKGLLICCVLGFVVYFVFAMVNNYRDEGATVLIIGTAFFLFRFLFSVFTKKIFSTISKILGPLNLIFKQYSKILNTIALVSFLVALSCLIVYDVVYGYGTVYNLVSLGGVTTYILLAFIFSSRPARIRWRTVLWGFTLQLVFASLILRWYYGYHILKWAGDNVSLFLDFSDVGAKFVFGDNFMDHFFAMKILPSIIFVSSFISILFHVGAMQWMIMKLSKIMESLMETTAGESFTAAGNIFFGMTEVPLAIKPLLPYMTDSELHAVITSGFATIAGACLAAYIGFGVPANHLLSASVMSAPAALAISKLVRPETKKTKTSSNQVNKVLNVKTNKNMIDAAANGAMSAVGLVGMVCANLLAFVSLLSLLNHMLAWFGKRVGLTRKLTFELICSYVLWPLAAVMGVNIQDCRKVAKLIGIKTFVNEFVAYLELKTLISNRVLFDNHVLNNGTWGWSDDGEDVLLHHPNGTFSTLSDGIIEDRSTVISTYALCGFSNFGSMGIVIGVFTALLPRKKEDLSVLVMSAMLAGNAACFVTACIAGLFYSPQS